MSDGTKSRNGWLGGLGLGRPGRLRHVALAAGHGCMCMLHGARCTTIIAL